MEETDLTNSKILKYYFQLCNEIGRYGEQIQRVDKKMGRYCEQIQRYSLKVTNLGKTY